MQVQFTSDHWKMDFSTLFVISIIGITLVLAAGDDQTTDEPVTEVRGSTPGEASETSTLPSTEIITSTILNLGSTTFTSSSHIERTITTISKEDEKGIISEESSTTVEISTKVYPSSTETTTTISEIIPALVSLSNESKIFPTELSNTFTSKTPAARTESSSTIIPTPTTTSLPIIPNSKQSITVTKNPLSEFNTSEITTLAESENSPTVAKRVGTASKLISMLNSSISMLESTTPESENNPNMVSQTTSTVLNNDLKITVSPKPEITSVTIKNITTLTPITQQSVTKIPESITSPTSKITPDSEEIASVSQGTMNPVREDRIQTTKPAVQSTTTEIQMTESENQESDGPFLPTEVPQNTTTNATEISETPPPEPKLVKGSSLALPIGMVCGSLLILIVTCALISLKRRKSRNGNFNFRGAPNRAGSLRGSQRANNIPQDNSDVPRFMIAMEKIPLHGDED